MKASIYIIWPKLKSLKVNFYKKEIEFVLNEGKSFYNRCKFIKNIGKSLKNNVYLYRLNVNYDRVKVNLYRM